MNHQDRFNNLCDRAVIARVAEIREAWLLSHSNYDNSDWSKYQTIIEDIFVIEQGMHDLVGEQRVVDRGDMRDELDMLEVVAAALFIVNPNIPENIKQPGPASSFMANWFANYLTRTAKFWQSKGSQGALVNAANEAVELGND